MNKFPVIFVAYKLDYGNTVLQLKPKRVNQVINNDNVFQRAILDDSEILDFESIDCFETVFPVKYSMNSFSFFIQVFHNRFGIVFGGGGEDINLIVFRNVF